MKRLLLLMTTNTYRANAFLEAAQRLEERIRLIDEVKHV